MSTAGLLGFKIPLQHLKMGKTLNFTPATVMTWRNTLTMVDLSSTTKQLYYTLVESSQVQIGTKDRLEILELLRPSVQFICQSLNKHYIDQPRILTKAQFTIAHLCQSLQLEMTQGYKIIIEQCVADGAPSEFKSTLLPIALQRAIHYYVQILVRSYKIYSPPPMDVWQDLHLITQYVSANFPNRLELIEDYKRILLLAGSDPLRWRQTEQDAIYRGTEIWMTLALLSDQAPLDSQISYLLIDPQADKPPIQVSRGALEWHQGLKILTVSDISRRLNDLLSSIEPNELQSRVSHYHQIEYTIPLPVIKGLVKIWGVQSARVLIRTPEVIPIEICTGLRALHFYVNHQKIFKDPKNTGLEQQTDTPTGRAQWVEEVESGPEADEENMQIDFSMVRNLSDGKNSEHYSLYPATIINETPTGYALTLVSEIDSNLQAGELLGLLRNSVLPENIEICNIRWLKYTADCELSLGVERLASTAKPGAIQLINKQKPVGDYVRCLIVEDTLFLPILPFKTQDSVNILLDSSAENPEVCELKELLEASAGYKRFRFVYRVVKKIATVPSLSIPVMSKVPEAPINQESTPPISTPPIDPFDQIWSQL